MYPMHHRKEANMNTSLSLSPQQSEQPRFHRAFVGAGKTSPVFNPQAKIIYRGRTLSRNTGGLMQIKALGRRNYYNDPLVKTLRKFEIVSFLFASIQIPTSLPITFALYLIDWTNYLAFWYAAYVFIASFMVFVLIEVTLFVYYFTRKELYE